MNTYTTGKTKSDENTVSGSHQKSITQKNIDFQDHRSEAVRQRKLQETANEGKNDPLLHQTMQLMVKSSSGQTIQRLAKGGDYTHKKLGKQAEENGWWNKDDGEFLVPGEVTEDYDEDTYQNEIHYHQYSAIVAQDDEVSISGHGVWAKKDGESRRQLYAMTSKKDNHGVWYIDSGALGDEELGFAENKNPDAKGKLLGAFDEFKTIFKDTMNANDDSDTDSDE